MITLTLNGHPYRVPTAWDELSGPQLVAAMRILGGPTEPAVAGIRLLQVLTGMSWWRTWFCSAEELREAFYLTDFLLEGNTLTKQILPKIGRLYGPTGGFSNLVMAEFVFAENHYLAFRSDETKTEHLDALCAVLYRPAKKRYNRKENPEGDVRAVFNENVYEARARRVCRRWPEAVKRAVLQFYDGCRGQMIRDYPAVFKEGEGEPARWGLISMMRSVAQSGVHGDFDRVEKKFVRMIMIELDEMIAEAERIERTKQKR